MAAARSLLHPHRGAGFSVHEGKYCHNPRQVLERVRAERVARKATGRAYEADRASAEAWLRSLEKHRRTITDALGPTIRITAGGKVERKSAVAVQLEAPDPTHPSLVVDVHVSPTDLLVRQIGSALHMHCEIPVAVRYE